MSQGTQLRRARTGIPLGLDAAVCGAHRGDPASGGRAPTGARSRLRCCERGWGWARRRVAPAPRCRRDRQAGGLDQPRCRRQVPRCDRHSEGRSLGHADPDATGVLVLGVGHATRLLRFLTELPKRYEGEIVLGTETTTLDAAGEITATHDMSAVTDDQVRAAANRLTGDLMQVPPMVSAIKIDGKRLHELAREGKEVDRLRVRCGSTASTSSRSRSAACGVVSSTARRGPTFARWLLISALRSAGCTSALIATHIGRWFHARRCRHDRVTDALADLRSGSAPRVSHRRRRHCRAGGPRPCPSARTVGGLRCGSVGGAGRRWCAPGGVRIASPGRETDRGDPPVAFLQIPRP